jgi:hypothetical protein
MLKHDFNGPLGDLFYNSYNIGSTRPILIILVSQNSSLIWEISLVEARKELDNFVLFEDISSIFLFRHTLNN